MNNIILVGFMGSGKSSVGRFLSQRLNLPFLDTDQVIEQDSNLTIPELFNIYGEKYFRLLENQLFEDIIEQKLSNYVIATGGGFPCYLKRREKFKSLGDVFYLRNSKKELINRVKNDSNRPLKFKINLFNQREFCYNSIADQVINCEFMTVEDVAEEILFRRE